MTTRPRRTAAALAGLALLLGSAGAAAADGVVRVLRPSFPPPVAAVQSGAGPLALSVDSSHANAIVDVRRWFARERIVPDEWAVGGDGDVPAASLPAAFARSYRGLPLRRAVRDRDLALLLYGREPWGGRFVVGADRRTGATRFALDLDALATAPGTPPAARGETRERAVWAAVRDGVLYVETAHDTYARTSAGRNGYLTAVDVEGGRIRWRSPALVANAATFAVVGDALVTGYGFTDEPDALYVLDRRTGRAAGRLALPSAPEYLAARRGRLYVRTYDHDVVVRLAVRR